MLRGLSEGCSLVEGAAIQRALLSFLPLTVRSRPSRSTCAPIKQQQHEEKIDVKLRRHHKPYTLVDKPSGPHVGH